MSRDELFKQWVVACTRPFDITRNRQSVGFGIEVREATHPTTGTKFRLRNHMMDVFETGQTITESHSFDAVTTKLMESVFDNGNKHAQ